MRIPLVDLKAQLKTIRPEIDEAIGTILENTAFVGGPTITKFEEEFAEFCGADHCVGLANGTFAVFAALWAVGVGPGDEVVLPTHTFIATSEAVRQLGAVPVLVDIDETTFNMDPALVEAAITPKTKAIVAVHLYGRAADMEALQQIADRHGIRLVADGAQSHGTLLNGKPAAQYGAITTYSFYPGKNLGAYGDGGAIVTNDKDLADRIRMYVDHGRPKGSKYLHETEGTNGRLDTLQAAILSVKMPHLGRWVDLRRQHARVYSEGLAGIEGLTLPDLCDDQHALHLYVIRVAADRRDDLLQHLKDKGIGAGIHYPVPLHLQPSNADLGYEQGAFPLAENVANEIVSLPMYPELTAEQIDHVIGAVRTFF